jgi:hypothetical protein
MAQKITRNFYLSEFSCKDEEKTPVPSEYLINVTLLAKNLQIIRDELNREHPGKLPEIGIVVKSGYRTWEHHKSIYRELNLGEPPAGSFHLTALAADIFATEKYSPHELYAVIERLITEGYVTPGGLSAYSWGVHYDARGYNARW